MIEIELNRNDLEDIGRQFAELKRQLDPGHLRVFLNQRAHPWIRQRVHDRFDSEGDAMTGPWEPLKRSTRRWRRSILGMEFEAHPILTRTGRLRQYVAGTYDTRETGPRSAEMTQPSTKFPSGSPRMREKLRRAQKGEGSTPRRPVIGLDAEDKRELTQRAEDWFDRVVRSL